MGALAECDGKSVVDMRSGVMQLLENRERIQRQRARPSEAWTGAPFGF